MAEDAFGYLDGKCKPKMRKQILIVDDINDTGATFEWIKKDWQAGCLPNSEGWDEVWDENVRFATMCEKTHTKFDGVNYVWEEIDTSEKDTWIVFPWEYD
jgi:hypoxanthine phosphoribosyltransferase